MQDLNPYDIYRVPEDAYNKMSVMEKLSELTTDEIEVPLKG